MTTGNTPDKELKAQLDKIFSCDCSFTKGFAFKPGDPCDGSCVNAPYRRAVLQLITADRKRVALEARLDENTRHLSRYKEAKIQPYAGSMADWFSQRIAELKAQKID